MHANACADYHHMITSGKKCLQGEKIILPRAPKSLKMALTVRSYGVFLAGALCGNSAFAGILFTVANSTGLKRKL
jgi:energy-converting hydrogenase Eha subunit G